MILLLWQHQYHPHHHARQLGRARPREAALRAQRRVHSDAATPLKLVEYYDIADKVFKYDTMTDEPAASEAPIKIALNVVNATYRTFIEIVFENPERSMRACHLDGYSFFPAGRGEPTHDPGVPAVVVGDLTDVRQRGDVEPAVGAVGAALLGRQLYISMLSPERSLRDE
ncbi:hypothetical protein GW17_00002300 [Ensete ventricosum]|nr:hypothetical protein GW17_00002300 [Ensete ventricosum]